MFESATDSASKDKENILTTTNGYKRILVACDFSPYSDAALQQAVWVARQNGASVTLAHTLPDLIKIAHNASPQAKLDLLSGNGEKFEREVRRDSDEKMRQKIAGLGLNDLDIKYKTYLGDAYIELTQAVQLGNYDLVFAGTRGRTAWEQFFVGSTAKRLIRMCPSAVWIVKDKHGVLPKVVTAATDFSEVSVQGVAQAYWIARHADAQFHLLHIIDSTDIGDESFAKLPGGAALREELEKTTQAKIDSLLETLQCDRDKVNVHMAWGTPWRELKRFVDEKKVDLLTMGTVGRSGIQGMLLGNTAERVLDTCNCSVLTLKPADYVSPI